MNQIDLDDGGAGQPAAGGAAQERAPAGGEVADDGAGQAAVLQAAEAGGREEQPGPEQPAAAQAEAAEAAQQQPEEPAAAQDGPRVGEREEAPRDRIEKPKVAVGAAAVETQRSNLVTHVHRQALEQGILEPITSGGGLFGTSRVDLHRRKLDALGGQGQGEDLPESEKLGGFLQDDGIYIDNSFLFKAQDINVQKLEERMLNTGQREYFKANGEVRIDNDLLADELTRPADLAFVQSDAFQTVENNAIVTDRLNSFKKRYYRIDIVIGKLSIRRSSELFAEEDQLMVDLRHMCKLYDRRVSLALIPFYSARREYLSRQGASKEAIANVQADLERERAQLETAAKRIFATWKKIEALRDRAPSTTAHRLRVHQGRDLRDVLFNLEEMPWDD